MTAMPKTRLFLFSKEGGKEIKFDTLIGILMS